MEQESSMSNLGLTKEDLNDFIVDTGKPANTDDHLDAMRYSLERDLRVKIGVDEDRIEWAKLCLRECQGITKEALEKGVISFALDWLMKHRMLDPDAPFIPNEKPVAKENATFFGVRIWEDDPEVPA
jgi:hypothetical protein